ncbi:MAG: lipid-A-disaccharide synthase [Gemmatimonadetes bacterium]|nr:lipid-A-disaccharide synthase [Gemmatimonadota bacterium]
MSLADPRIFLIAGEPSGDLHGAGVARALRARWPDAELVGLGGNLMAAAGVELLAHVDSLAIMGFVEVASRLPFFMRLWRRVRSELRQRPPDLLIPIDYPGFNLRLTRAAHASGLRVLYYIAPQVWAWHRSRAKKLARWADRLAVILPFEEPLFAAAGGRPVFVGHPLLDVEPARVSRDEFCAPLGLDPARPILALFPGSRAQEIERHLSLFVATAAEIARTMPDVQPVIAAGAALGVQAFESIGVPRTTDAWRLLDHAGAALVKSGTSTLQAALTRTPMVVTYRMNPLTFALARRVVRVEHVGLVNLVAGMRAVPEVLQDDATPVRLASQLLPFLDADNAQRVQVVERLARVRAALQPPGNAGSVAGRVADLAAEILA